MVHRDGRRHGNADGLSRRPPTSEAQKEVSSFHQEKNEDDEKLPKLKAIGQTNNETDSFAGEEALLVRESLASLQKEDLEFGPIVRMRLDSAQKPPLDEVMTESELTKRI